MCPCRIPLRRRYIVTSTVSCRNGCAPSYEGPRPLTLSHTDKDTFHAYHRAQHTESDRLSLRNDPRTSWQEKIGDGWEHRRWPPFQPTLKLKLAKESIGGHQDSSSDKCCAAQSPSVACLSPVWRIVKLRGLSCGPKSSYYLAACSLTSKVSNFGTEEQGAKMILWTAACNITGYAEDQKAKKKTSTLHN